MCVIIPEISQTRVLLLNRTAYVEGDREGRVCVRRGNVLAFFNGLIKIYSVTLGI